MNVLAFGASYSSESINKDFAEYVGKFFSNENTTVDVMDLIQFELPLFTIDIEDTMEFPDVIDSFLERLGWADLLIISMSEHNGAYQAAFKNLLDWTSRKKMEMFEGSKMFLLSTSPGARGGASVMELALNRFPIHGADIVANFSLPSFEQNYSYKEGILDPTLKAELMEKIDLIKSQIS